MTTVEVEAIQGATPAFDRAQRDDLLIGLVQWQKVGEFRSAYWRRVQSLDAAPQRQRGIKVRVKDGEKMRAVAVVNASTGSPKNVDDFMARVTRDRFPQDLNEQIERAWDC